MDYVVDTGLLSVPLVRSGTDPEPMEPVFEAALEGMDQEGERYTGKAGLAMHREAHPDRLTVVDLPGRWDKPIGDKWFGERECTPSDHFYEDLGSLYAERGATPYDGVHIHESCHTFEDVESYPPRALATEIDVDAGACVLAGLSELVAPERTQVRPKIEQSPDTATSYELTARAFLRSIPEEPADFESAAKSVVARAREDGLLLSHAESYDHYGHGAIGVGSEVTVADGDLVVSIDRQHPVSPQHLPQTWLLYGGTVTQTAIDRIDEGDVVAVGARAITSCSPAEPPSTDVAVSELSSLDARDPRAVALLRLLAADEDEDGPALSDEAKEVLVGFDPDDQPTEDERADLLAENRDVFVEAVAHENRLVRSFARQLLVAIAKGGRTDVFLVDIDRWFDLVFERDENDAFRTIINRTAKEHPEAFTSHVADLLEFAEQTDRRSSVTGGLAEVVETDVEAFVPHVERLCDYVRDGEWDSAMASDVLAPVANHDPSLVSSLVEDLATAVPDNKSAKSLRPLVHAAPSVVEDHIETIASPDHDPERSYHRRHRIQLLSDIARYYPEHVGDYVAELLPLCDEEEYGEGTVEATRETILRVAIDHPDAVTPYASALADEYRNSLESYSSGPLFAGIFAYLLQHDLEAAKAIDVETFAGSLLDYAADNPVFPEDLTPALDGQRLTDLATGDDETTALMAHAVLLHLDLVDRVEGVDSPILEGGDVVPAEQKKPEADDGMRVIGHDPDFDLEDLVLAAYNTTGRRRHAALIGLGEFSRYSGKDVILDHYDKLVELAATTEGDARGRVFQFMRRHPRSEGGDPADVPDAAIDQAIDALDDNARRPRLRAVHMLLHTIPANGQDRLEANLDSLLDLYDDERVDDASVSQLLAAFVLERPDSLSSIDTAQLLEPVDEDTYLPNGEYADVVSLVEERN